MAVLNNITYNLFKHFCIIVMYMINLFEYQSKANKHNYWLMITADALKACYLLFS